MKRAVRPGKRASQAPQARLTTNSSLSGLGFDTKVGPPLDGAGQPLPSNYDPSRKQVSTFHAKAELYAAGLDGLDAASPKKQEVLFEDKQTPRRSRCSTQ